jgi:hypothetical protein
MNGSTLNVTISRKISERGDTGCVRFSEHEECLD